MRTACPVQKVAKRDRPRDGRLPGRTQTILAVKNLQRAAMRRQPEGPPWQGLYRFGRSSWRIDLTRDSGTSAVEHVDSARQVPQRWSSSRPALPGTSQPRRRRKIYLCHRSDVKSRSIASSPTSLRARTLPAAHTLARSHASPRLRPYRPRLRSTHRRHYG